MDLRPSVLLLKVEYAGEVKPMLRWNLDLWF